MAKPLETRDLLAERLLRLERRIGDLGDQIGATASHVERASQQLDALVGLVGRLSHVVDVQGESLQGDEDQLEAKLSAMENQVGELADHLRRVASRLESLAPASSGRPDEKKKAD